jgi:tetratricopeptide (TPR) repeat protein
MKRETVKKPKRNGNRNGKAIGPRRSPKPRVSVPVVPAEPAGSLAHNGSSLGTTQFRFQLASMLRVADNLVSRAVGAYDRMFALDQTETGDIYLQMGKQLAREDKLDEALEALRKVPESKAQHAEAMYEVGLIHLRRGAPQAAVELLRKARASGFRHQRLHLQLARVLGSLERYDEALRELDTVVELSPDLADGHYQRAIALDHLGRYAEAVDAFRTAIHLCPTEVRYHQSLGFTLETLGKRRDAIQCFKRALEMERNVEHANEPLEL